MSYILNLETSTKNCSVSISESGKVLAIKELNNSGYSHAEKLHVFIEEVLKTAQLTYADLAGVAVGKGPGSYTGLRIGVSAAKGLCFALDIPMFAIESLTILAHTTSIEEGLIVPMLDARRLEVYSAVFDKDYQQIRNTEAQIIDETSFSEYLEQGKVYFVGDGAEKCKAIITHENAVFIDDKFPSAKEMAALSEMKFKADDKEDVAYFEPFYLKDFVGTKPKKRA
ncbi:tRNA (adenosine(37)-N6)-threonylcarbamoyltransferase complex dimerization subunit type 1 TsaB [Flavicella sediminum]|uniref:tRNA (adenosine(37)-N6)-threonylcarbamoyltransferase complex dimerization subunit type 1 TsaB n=1 Tax=Flavicella sediminum TaxID=2585141 RepID=UPI0011216A7A|nr:tRNA (adenosine(37)-N6)-threonylcarbamoyltransferase complex dimerization subunit type 1 TsaB [Flavicella sediminum]